MAVQRSSFAVLIGVSCLWLGCNRVLSAQSLASNVSSDSPVDQKGGSKPAVKTVDKDSILFRLLKLETVQRDLDLTADQVSECKALTDAAESEMQTFLVKSSEIFPPSFPQEELLERKRKFQALSDDWKRKDDELRAKALTLLTPSQTERLKQIRLQRAALTALTWPEIVKALDISSEQLANIQALDDKAESVTLAEFPDVRGLSSNERRQKSAEFVKKSTSIRTDCMKRALDVLTSEQRTKFDKLQGKKISTDIQIDFAP